MTAKFMRFLDLDLDFFLNGNAYLSSIDSGRPGPEYKPWSVPKVRHFLEYRCRLSSNAPVWGRTVESHDEVLGFWRSLVESGRLAAPFEVIHIDAHPDLCATNGLSLRSGFLCIDPEQGLASLRGKRVHSGNYLTFAVVWGWVDSLVWVPLSGHLRDAPGWDADARSILRQSNKRTRESSLAGALPGAKSEPGVPFKILPWQRFRTSETFDYIALSRSPDFTPRASDKLITVIEEYMKQL